MFNCKYSVILGFLGKLNDRFSTYGEVRDALQTAVLG